MTIYSAHVFTNKAKAVAQAKYANRILLRPGARPYGVVRGQHGKYLVCKFTSKTNRTNIVWSAR